MAHAYFFSVGHRRRFSQSIHYGKKDAEENRRNGKKALNERQVVQQLKRANWFVLGLLSLTGLLMINPFFSLSILMGGLIIIANFNLLHRSILRCTMDAQGSRSPGGILARYYLRILGTGLVIALLLMKGWVVPVGLVVGLSTVMLTMVACGLYIIKRAWIEEA